MAMLVPTLLQFSKTRGSNRTQDKPIFDTWGKQNSLAPGSKETDSTSVATKIQEQGKASIPDHQEVEIPDFNKASTSTAQLCIPSRVESSVDQLYSQMGRIDDLFLRFEEKMLKPITIIEARLERVDQQLEVLVNKSQNSGLPTCARFYASSFSCNESESNSCYICGNDYHRCEAFESGKKDIQPNAPPTTAYEMSASVNSTHLLPSLVVTAPEFLNGDEDEDQEDHGSDVVIGSLEKPRPDLTLDDALASALAGFMSLTLTQPEKHAQTLLVKAPDFLNEEDGSVERKESTTEEHEVGTDSSMCLGETDATENIKGSLADLTKNSPEGEGNFLIRSPNDEHTDKTLRVDGLDQHSEDGEKGKLDDDKSIENAFDPANRGMSKTDFCQITEDNETGDVSTEISNIPDPDNKRIENAIDPANRGVSKTDFCQITEDNENGDVGTEISNIPDPDNTDVQNELPQHQIDDGYDNTKKVASTDSDLTLQKEVTEENSDNDTLKSILEFSHAASVVDFEIPVLDVKFTSQDSCDNGYFSLEALLAEFPESVTEAPVEESGDVLPIGAEGCDLIFVEDGEPVGAAPDGNFSVDMNLYGLEPVE